MRLSDKEMARRCANTPGPGPQPLRAKEITVDERILAQSAQLSPTELEHEGREERRSCFYCLEGWVFLGSIGYEGEEVLRGLGLLFANITTRPEALL
jgi:hypothetical protein